ncbi:ABC transporter ATP-binding protein [Corynebacterium epidermidicanis]|uniref:ABC-type cobalamin/Fe3+-siderophore transport system, ATPase component n=1 Tax=Corynebacterium epidermidicanis TaxID=1050174 RepID=A0A0G3GSZ6_9CORY|nr:ABC transporter ATP-binding protein [Corynebacterium epidermidicanis]AKK01987.1 ABC-type cobalamin/Fe3+-siderophore transport system, ATPase component [Corynebacterium epidermidicanis]
MTSLRADNATLAWDNNVISRKLSVELPRAAFTAIIGPNGCGKSTLLKSFARILTPTEGAVFLGEDNLRDLGSREVATRLAFLPQTTVTPPDITVSELVRRGRFPHQSLLKPWSREDSRAVSAALSAASVAELADVRVAELSGGQRQRVWLAMVLAQNTPALLLDEPTTYLDISHQYGLLELAKALVTQLDRTVVAVLHDLQQAVRYADHLIVMKNGEIVATGVPEEIVTSELIREVFGISVAVHTLDGQVVVVPKGLATPDVRELG